MKVKINFRNYLPSYTKQNLLEVEIGFKLPNWWFFSSEFGVSSSLNLNSSIFSAFAWNLIDIDGTEVVTGLPKILLTNRKTSLLKLKIKEQPKTVVF